MSHLDPYRSPESRSWDRPDAPAALPWPDRDLEPGQWARTAATDAYAPVAPGGLAEARRPAGRPEPFDADATDPYGARPVPAGPGDPVGAAGPRGGPLRPGDRHPSDGPDGSFPGHPPAGPVYLPEEPAGGFVEPEPSRGRRRPGRRRASAERPPTEQAPPSRAGRNLPAAIGVGVGLGAAVLLPLFFYLPGFLLVLAAAMAIGIWEMARAVRRSGAHPPLVPLITGGVLMVGLAWFAGPDALSLGLLVTVLGTMIWRLGDGPGDYQRDLTAATLIAVYVPFLGGFAAMLAAAPGDGHLRVLVTLVAVVLSDTGGYAAGANFGKHPMAPSISPKKSWEGFAGSVTAAAVGSALLIWLLFDVAPWWGALFGVAVSCAAVLGDLAESMIKRDLGVKDMSNLLPGHGGLMDRLDSILFAVPTAYLLLAVFAPVAG
ncbi:phosphatidate cytidylyltransferase [Micromonospora sp. ATCC 39149]|uniref:Phosphatidate cytidylyltransferase n=1 Tax=Micromonospora carbonacea TaxID=47853 RepID=A0A7D6CH04_9ACTN|nr:phosphatidate cytidylyltransferase [Micromonospora sp. ATCC 39149]EEP73966.1 phosphatidate cytidylyltransferase [Micromonospora sp. ATCC 39149]QLK01258.1 phosphatidate cytidylyltransferase [Micromonospora carbonacea]